MVDAAIPRLAATSMVSPYAGIVTGGMTVAALLQRGRPWIGESMWTVEFIAIPVLLGGAVLAAAVATDVATWSRDERAALASSTRRARRVLLLPVLWAWGGAVLAHLLCLAVALTVGRVSNPDVGWPPMAGAVSVQLLTYLWFACLGLAVGVLLPQVLAGLAAGVVAVALGYVFFPVGADGRSFVLLDLGASTVSQTGMRWDASYLGTQAALLLLLATTSLVFAVMLRRWAWWRWAHVVLTVGCIVAVLAYTPHGPTQRKHFAVPPVTPSSCTVGGLYTFCSYREHWVHRSAFEAEVDNLIQTARSKGYDDLLPLRVMEWSRGYSPAGKGVMSFSIPNSLTDAGEVDTVELIRQLVTPECPYLSSPDRVPPDSFWRLQGNIIGTWLSLVGKDPSMVPRGSESGTAFTPLTPTQLEDGLVRLRSCPVS